MGSVQIGRREVEGGKTNVRAVRQWAELPGCRRPCTAHDAVSVYEEKCQVQRGLAASHPAFATQGRQWEKSPKQCTYVSEWALWSKQTYARAERAALNNARKNPNHVNSKEWQPGQKRILKGGASWRERGY